MIGDLLARVERLERLISRNSGNSSMPPPADDLSGRQPPPGKPARKAGRRKPGKQPGSPGSHLAWSEDPDDTVPHFPDGTCACGAALSGAADPGVTASHQQVEIPLASAKVIQHDLHAVACGCGKVHQAARPGGVGAARVSYGPNLQAWCVFLMVAHAIPVHRCAELIESLTGARPSAGFVHAILARAAGQVAGANKLIRALIILAHVVCADETPIRAGPGPKSRKRYLLVACTRLCTYYLPGDRDLATFAAFVLPDLDGTVVVPDRYQNYDAFPGLIAAPLEHAFRHGVILRFVYDLRIPPTSNQAERDARPAKTQQKISGRLRSEETTRHRYTIRGYISTASKHGTDILTALRDAILGHPWMPPIPDPP